MQLRPHIKAILIEISENAPDAAINLLELLTSPYLTFAQKELVRKSGSLYHA